MYKFRIHKGNTFFLIIKGVFGFAHSVKKNINLYKLVKIKVYMVIFILNMYLIITDLLLRNLLLY